MEEVKETLPSNYVTLALLQQRWKKQQNQPQQKLLQNAICNNHNPPNYLTLAQLRERRNQQQQQNDNHRQIEANCPRKEKENRNDVVQVPSSKGNDTAFSVEGIRESKNDVKVKKTSSGDIGQIDADQVGFSEGNDTVSAVEGIRESENDVKKKKISSVEISQNDIVQVASSQGNCTAVEGNCEGENCVKKKKYKNWKQRKNIAKEKLIKEEDRERAGGEKENEKVSVPEVQVPLSAIEEKSEIIEVKECEVHAAPVINRGKEKAHVVYRPLMNVESKTVEVEACGMHKPIIKRGSAKIKTKREYHKINRVDCPSYAPLVGRGKRYEIKNGMRGIDFRPTNAVEEAGEVAAVETLEKENREMVSVDTMTEEARDVASVETIQEEVREMAAVETLEKEDGEMFSVDITIEEARDMASVETIEKRIGCVLIDEKSNEKSKMTVDDNRNGNSNSSVNKVYYRSVGNRRDSQYRGYRYTFDRFQSRKTFEYKGYGYNGVSRNNGYGGGARRWADDTRGTIWVKKGVVADVGDGTGA